MIDLAETNRHVAAASVRFDLKQSEFNRARDALNAELYRAFRDLWPGKAGDRISANVGGKYRVEGRAVIMRNGSRMALYVDTGQQRCPVVEPYKDNATIVRKPR